MLTVVKGTSRRVIVVDSPDPNLFEQAIFILKNDVYTREGVTQQQVLGEACRIAKGYASAKNPPVPLWKKIPWWAWLTLAGAALILLMVLL
ncbi:MAG: translation initiation factor 2 [Oscillospiraceae bacterium]|nr:translation initiation factor 2 [Oscillospiraceae bacterium]